MPKPVLFDLSMTVGLPFWQVGMAEGTLSASACVCGLMHACALCHTSHLTT